MRNAVSRVSIFWGWMVLVLGSVAIGEVATFSETDFENGEKTPWQRFVTPNGTIGGAEWPTIVPFDMLQDTRASKSLKFQAGQRRYDPEGEAYQGGGVFVEITTEAGIFHLSADIAVTYHSPKDKRNLAGGRIEWMVDEHVVASHDMGPIENGNTLRHHLEGRYQVDQGHHILRVRITRPFISHPGQHTPFQYLDNLSIRFAPSP